MGRLFWLSDRQFELIKPHLPYRAAGKRREDDRRIISGIIHVLQSGCRWRDCPPEYGPSTTVYNRYNRWSQKVHWQYLFAELTAVLSGTPEQISIDASCPSSKQMGLLSVFHKGGSGSSLFDVKPLGVDGSSGGFGWSVF